MTQISAFFRKLFDSADWPGRRHSRQVLEAEVAQRKTTEGKLKNAISDFQLLVSNIKDYAIFMIDKEWHAWPWRCKTGTRRPKDGITPSPLIPKPGPSYNSGNKERSAA
jgi:hypothetical protein